MQWYVRDTDLGGIFGPYEDQEDAVLVANRMASGLIFSEVHLDNVVLEKKVVCIPGSILPDWGCYGSTPPNIIGYLNDCGLSLICAIQANRSPGQIIHCMNNLRDMQVKYSEYGADDTGSKAIWELVKNACIGTCFDPEKFWEKYYV